MKNLYHLLVTRYKLHVTSYKLHIARFKRFTSHLLPHTSYLIPLFAFCFFPAAVFAQTQEATVTNVVFSCPGTVTVTYDLNLDPCNFVDVTLYYSSENCGWLPAVTEENVQPGTGKTITWNAAADNVSFGKFYYKVEYPVTLADGPEPVFINGLYWSPVNLDVGGKFCCNEWDYGGYYQWGRVADGHERRTSPCWPLTPACGTPGGGILGVVSLALGAQVPCPAAPCGYFIRHTAVPLDWRTPQDNALWNSGTEANPVKTANDPCPDGWRVPTRNELNALFSRIINSPSAPLEIYPGTTMRGRWFGDGGVPSLFLPAVGYRSGGRGAMYYSYDTNPIGHYWSSTPGTNTDAGPTVTTAYYLYFYQSTINGVITTYNYRGDGMPIRCVHE